MNRRFFSGKRVPDSGDALSRRRIFTGVVGAAAAGVAGGTALPKAFQSPSTAGGESQRAVLTAATSTTVEQGAVAPVVVVLVDGPTIAVDASLGNDFRVTVAGNRTVGTPANPVDGQKITCQVTQGAGAPFTLSWSSGYEFSAGLPQPTLSTTAGQTDLLGFIYNASKGKWLCAAFVSGFASTTVTQPPPGTYRLFPTTDGPATPASYSGPFVCGVVTGVTSGACWLDGYWWWVCPSGQSMAAQQFALWCLYTPDSGSLIANSTVISGSLTAGQWNYVQLQAPVPLAIGATYVAVTGFTGNFPITENQFGSGDLYSGGIVNGPLTAYSDPSGTLPSWLNTAQAVFSTATADPTTAAPVYGTNSSNFWMDVQVTTSAPAGTSYRLWPGYPRIPGNIDSDTAGYTLAMELRLSQSCTLDNIWFYSASGAGALPSRCGIWDVSSQSEVPGADNNSPTWSGGAGSGWVACAYNGVTLPAGDYKVAVYYGGGSQWYQATASYWDTGSGANGITAGPVTAPGTSAATSPGQSTYNPGSWAYPQSYASAADGECYWVDIEVTPAS